jgi:hypothetical protein
MPSVIESMKFGLKKYMEKGAFGALAEMNNKSKFGADNGTGDAVALAAGGISLIVILFLMFGGVILGWMAVSHLCNGKDERSKNIRLGLYAILLFTGGQVGWFYAILWLLKVNVCA